MNYTGIVADAAIGMQLAGGHVLPHGFDLLTSAIGGIAAGITAVWVYTYRKNSEYVSNRNDMAVILANEIRRNIRSYDLDHIRPMPASPYDRIPSMDTYKGLVLSGNIRYFSDDVQDMMDNIRSTYEPDRTPDIILHKEVLSKLDRIPQSRDRFFVWIPHWRWWAKTWSRRRDRGARLS